MLLICVRAPCLTCCRRSSDHRQSMTIRARAASRPISPHKFSLYESSYLLQPGFLIARSRFRLKDHFSTARKVGMTRQQSTTFSLKKQLVKLARFTERESGLRREGSVLHFPPAMLVSLRVPYSIPLTLGTPFHEYGHVLALLRVLVTIATSCHSERSEESPSVPQPVGEEQVFRFSRLRGDKPCNYRMNTMFS